MPLLTIRRDTHTGHANYVVDGSSPIDLPLPTDTAKSMVPHRPGEPRDVPFHEWCDANRHDLRRMVRFVRSRMSHGGIDWDGVAQSLARYAYATSGNRHKSTPAIR